MNIEIEIDDDPATVSVKVEHPDRAEAFRLARHWLSTAEGDLTNAVVVSAAEFGKDLP